MKEKEFNLLQTPWVLLMRDDGKTETRSLMDAFRCAHEYKRLAGESALQDVAVLRLMLAVLHTVFSRYDVDGAYAPLNDAVDDAEPQDVLERWSSLWACKAFPMEPIERYLAQYEERFYLFHPTTPFYQVANMGKGTSYSAAKLNGELSESSNKLRLFPMRAGARKGELSYAEAARWLLYLNGFDDTSSKSKDKGDGSPGAGWLGKLGLLYANGETLFETLLLNLVMLRGNALWGEESPIWERPPRTAVRKEIALPDNPSELLTLQSRRMFLDREDDKVVGYELIGGDFFQKENALAEQMTLWRNTAKKEGDPPLYVPRRHDPARKLWRDFASIAAQVDNKRRPGVIGWISVLRQNGCIPLSVMRFSTVSLKYGDKDFFADDAFQDELSFNLDLLTELGKDWLPRIEDAVTVSETLAKQVGYLAQDLVKCCSAADGSGQGRRAMAQAYFRFDEPFRLWLEQIDPKRDGDSKDAVSMAWIKTAQGIARGIGRELVAESDMHAFVGRSEKDRNGTERRYTAPEAYNKFLAMTATNRLTI